MDRATIQARVNAGMAAAAGVLGAPYRVYRPADPMRPLGAPLGVIQAVVGRGAEGFDAPAGYEVAARTLLADAGGLAVGDVLVGEAGTLFVAAMPAGVPPLLVDCNATLGVLSMVPSSGYGGAAERGVASGWPASLRLSGRGQASAAGLPGDVHAPGWEVLLPAIPGVALVAGMRAVDAAGRRFGLAGVELSGLGYRIAASYGGT